MADTPRSSPPRFTLAGLLELIAGIGLFLALVSQLEWVGLGMAVAGLLIIAAVQHVAFADDRQRAVRNVWHCLIGLVILLLAVALLLPAVSTAREAGRRAWCANNLRQLALALHSYFDDHGHLPPPYLADAEGKPMHSWRVLILPHLERSDLYSAYRLDEPWNGPNNSKLATRMPDVFRCPSDPQMPPGMTSYFAITGPGRMKEGKPQLELADITDGTANTIALAESSSARVNWLEPRDLTLEDIMAGENTAEAPCPCSRHHQKDRGLWRSAGNVLFHVAMFDASVQPLSSRIDAATLRALLTIAGGESNDLDSIPRVSDAEYLWPGFWVLLAAEVAFVIFAIVRRLRIARRVPEVPHG